MRFNSYKKMLLTIAVLCFGLNSARACKYNVRETGFVDLEMRQYAFYIFVDHSVSQQSQSDLQNISDDILQDSNIDIELVDVEKHADHPGIFVWEKEGALPQCVLVSPDGQILPVLIDDFRSELKSLIDSAKRREIVKKAIKHYAVVLLIEGRNANKNQHALGTAKSAIKHISSKMDMLPKPIKHPPVMASIKQNLFVDEKVLLWSLGLDAAEIDEPHLAVIYGKARWIGPLISGDQLTKSNMVNLMLIIGADCECGLDKTWLQGTMLPLKWDASLQKQTANNLGFDAESPYVRMEMMAIMRNSMMYSSSSMPAHGFADSSISRDTFEEAKPFSNSDSQTELNEKVKSTSPFLSRSILLIALFLGLVVVSGGIIWAYKRRQE
jgi:hypothetical protein